MYISESLLFHWHYILLTLGLSPFHASFRKKYLHIVWMTVIWCWISFRVFLIQLATFVEAERKKHTIYPPESQVWSWTQMCDIKDVSVVVDLLIVHEKVFSISNLMLGIIVINSEPGMCNNQVQNSISQAYELLSAFYWTWKFSWDKQYY